jgi:hypothetical protein
MTLAESQKKLNDLCTRAQSICETAKTAKKHSKSLSGRGFYAEKFHTEALGLQRLEAESLRLIEHAHIPQATIDDFRGGISIVGSAGSTPSAKVEAVRKLRSLCQNDILPHVKDLTANPVPATEQVLPMDVVVGTRDYLKHVIRQANGCYEHQWFDACGVMMRKFVEILIIHVFEAQNIADRIKGRDGNFLMLGDLVDSFLAEHTWNAGRETKSCLPLVKQLGDRSAHNRTFMARKADVDKALAGFRATAEELIHLGKLR